MVEMSEAYEAVFLLLGTDSVGVLMSHMHLRVQHLQCHALVAVLLSSLEN